ncbi:hypothetical protein LCGC14_1420910, partial [marine sediment metagenome]
MDPELVQWLRRANEGRRKGLSDAEIDQQLEENEVGFSYAELVEMARTQREEPVVPVSKTDVAITYAQGGAFNLLDEIVSGLKFAGKHSPLPELEGADFLQQELKEGVKRYREQDPVGAF